MTRVELHDAIDDDYQVLHEAMEDRGFARTITSDDGVKYHLPPAEYYFDGKATRQEVLNKAKAAAKVTGKKFAAIVTESNGITWNGLARVS